MRVAVAVFLAATANATFSQTLQKLESLRMPDWQVVDQLCGQLELSQPTQKTIVVKNKRETPFYTTYLSDYRAGVSDGACCGSARPVAHTYSGRNGAFEFSQFQIGLYWLQVKKGHLERAIPVKVTRTFDARLCHDSSIGRSFIVDSPSPKVQTRIR
jgi:hypothetical protein